MDCAIRARTKGTKLRLSAGFEPRHQPTVAAGGGRRSPSNAEIEIRGWRAGHSCRCAGAALGGLTGALIGMGIPEYEAKRYEGKVREGHILISVHAENRDERTRAKRIFEQAGAEDVADTAEARV